MDMQESAEKKEKQAASGNGKGSVLLGYLKAERVGVSIRGLRKSFGDNHVLRGVDLEVSPGETVVILGKSGTGKSFRARLLAEARAAGSAVFPVPSGGSGWMLQ